MNFDDMEQALALKPVSQEPQLVFIPVDEENGVVAVVKPFGAGQAACFTFAPAFSKHMPFSEFKPAYLRSLVTTDFALRQGDWKPLNLDDRSAAVLKGAVTGLLSIVERTPEENIVEIDMTRPSNTTSAADVAFTVYKTGENTPFEQGLRHLMGVEAAQKQSAQGDDN